MVLTTSSFICSIVTVQDAITHLGLVNALPAHAAVEVLLRAVVTVQLITKVWTVNYPITHSTLLARLLQTLDTA